MEFFPVPLPWKIMNFSHIFFSNKLRVIFDILKSNQITRDSRHFAGKSIFGKSEGRGVIIGGNFVLFFSMFQTI